MKNYFWINQLKKDFYFDLSYKITFFGQFFGIFLTVIIFYYISSLITSYESQYLSSYQNNYFVFAITGIALIDLIGQLLRSISISIRNAQAFGYIDSVINSGFRVTYLICCFMIYPLFKGLIRFLAYILLCFMFSDFDINLYKIISIFLIICMTVIPLISVAILCGAFVLVFKQYDPIYFFTNSIITIFSGIVYPIEVLPSLMQHVSNIIPVTLSLETIRQVLINDNLVFPSQFYYVHSLFIIFIMFILAIFLINFSITYVKKRGTSGTY